jgi:hypothetical protein
MGKVDECLFVLIATHPYTLSTEDTPVRIIGDKWIRSIQWRKLRGEGSEMLGPLELLFDFGGHLLEIASCVLPAIATIKIVIADQQFESGAPYSLDAGCLGLHFHAVFYRQRA